MFRINESSRISDLQLSNYSEFASQLPGRVTTRVTPTSTIMANLLSKAFWRPHLLRQIHYQCLLQEGDHKGRPYGTIMANLLSRAFGRPHLPRQIHCRCLLLLHPAHRRSVMRSMQFDLGMQYHILWTLELQ